MPTRCSSITHQTINILPGQLVLGGSELVDGSVIINNSEEYPMQYTTADGYAGQNGAVIIWPETGDDVLQFGPGESIPPGTIIHQGSVYDNSTGQWHSAPYELPSPGPGGLAGPQGSLDIDGDPLDLNNVDTSNMTAEEIAALQEQIAQQNQGLTKGSIPNEDDALSKMGICDPDGNINMPSEEELEAMKKFANFEMPEFKFWQLSGFTAFITKQLNKLGTIMGAIEAEVDKILAKVEFGEPGEICKPPIPATIKKLMDLMAWVLKVARALNKVLKILKAIVMLVKIAKKIILWVFAPLKLVQKFLDLLNVISLVDMIVSMLLKTVSKFMAIIPILQAQLMGILAACKEETGQDAIPPEDCDNWITEEDLKELEDLYEEMSNAANDIGYGADLSGGGGSGGTGEVGFCSVNGPDGLPYGNQQDCEDNGGTWLTGENPDDLEGVDTSALAQELQNVTDELNSCFSDPELQDFLNEISGQP